MQQNIKDKILNQIKNHRINGANVGLTKEIEVYHAGVVENIVLNAIVEAKQEQWELMNKDMHQFIEGKIAEIEKKCENVEMLDSEAGFIAGLKCILKELKK